MFDNKRIVLSLAVVGVLLTATPAFAGDSSQAPSPVMVTPDGGSNPIGSECQPMMKAQATRTFRHTDGSPSDRSEWKLVESWLRHKGPIVETREVPQDFLVYGPSWGYPGRVYTLEGQPFKGKRFDVFCLTDPPGTGHTNVPPQACPQTEKEAHDWIGGKKKSWISWIPTSFEGIRNALHYVGKMLGGFTVSAQALVSTVSYVKGNTYYGETYAPGDIVPPSRELVINCYK